MRIKLIGLSLLMVLLYGCSEKKEPVVTPWGTTLNDDDSVKNDKNFSLSDIQNNGELIMLTLSGPETYYDYHGYGMGTQYRLCERFAQQIGVSLRVEVCKDTTEMISRLQKGEADIIAFPLPGTLRGVRFCGYRAQVASPKPSKGNAGKPSGSRTKKVSQPSADIVQWAVKADNQELADTLNRWFRPEMVAEVERQESFLLSTRSITRHVYSPMLSRATGVISHYDGYFQRYAPAARMDWRLLAAQCYQESTFDPNAHSWAGAQGLMQIMPSTASHLGLSASDLTNPEKNIAASVMYIAELSRHFLDVGDPSERTFFVLASYNGGYFHIRDAMALARKHGRNPYRWGDVSEYVLKLSDPAYYRDPVVRNGYMRGSETVDYVYRIRNRWAQYRGVAHGGFSSSGVSPMPQRARHKYRFHI